MLLRASYGIPNNPITYFKAALIAPPIADNILPIHLATERITLPIADRMLFTTDLTLFTKLLIVLPSSPKGSNIPSSSDSGLPVPSLTDSKFFLIDKSNSCVVTFLVPTDILSPYIYIISEQ